jgi:hypothetical protein
MSEKICAEYTCPEKSADTFTCCISCDFNKKCTSTCSPYDAAVDEGTDNPDTFYCVNMEGADQE